MGGAASSATVRKKANLSMSTHSSDITTTTMHRRITYPFCGLLCDDLAVGMHHGQARLEPDVCPREVALFSSAGAA